MRLAVLIVAAAIGLSLAPVGAAHAGSHRAASTKHLRTVLKRRYKACLRTTETGPALRFMAFVSRYKERLKLDVTSPSCGSTPT